MLALPVLLASGTAASKCRFEHFNLIGVAEPGAQIAFFVQGDRYSTGSHEANEATAADDGAFTLDLYVSGVKRSLWPGCRMPSSGTLVIRPPQGAWRKLSVDLGRHDASGTRPIQVRVSSQSPCPDSNDSDESEGEVVPG
jgi:hypothetical protein